MANLANFRLFVICLLQICTFRVNSKFYDNPKVSTSLGELIGTLAYVEDIENKQELFVKQFLSVPFAQPPLRHLRFGRPEPVEPWGNCSLWCHTLPNACYQFGDGPFPWNLKDIRDIPRNFTELSIETWKLKHLPMSEDCLYMNIWVPQDASPHNKKSVLFFVHGGGFVEGMGSARQSVYQGRVLSALGDVIVVVPNYRLGIFGFWTNGDDDAPGNMGIWDVIEALRWVNTHIENFGGDKDSVTIAGQGAGGVIVSLLGVTSEAKGLYKRQIIQSGSRLLPTFDIPKWAFNSSLAISEDVHCENTAVVTDCMREKTPLELIRADIRQEYFSPVWGEELFPESPKKAFLEGKFRFTDLFIGMSGREGLPQITQMRSDILGYLGEKELDLDTNHDDHLKILDHFFRDPAFHSKLHDLYFFKVSTCNKRRYDWRLSLGDLIGDYFTICPMVHFAQAYVDHGVNVYFYDFEYRPSKSAWARWIGPTHFDEVDFVFGGPLKASTSYPDGDRYISKMMIKHWSNFVKNGEPSDDWPLFLSNKAMRYIGVRDPVQETIPRSFQCDTLKTEFYDKDNGTVPYFMWNRGNPETNSGDDNS